MYRTAINAFRDAIHRFRQGVLYFTTSEALTVHAQVQFSLIA
jgi:hypothetical protein